MHIVKEKVSDSQFGTSSARLIVDSNFLISADLSE